MQKVRGPWSPGAPDLNGARTVRTRTVIVGNSAAALSAIRAIRQRSADPIITLVSREDCCAYSPALTTHYLSDQMPEEKLFILAQSLNCCSVKE